MRDVNDSGLLNAAGTERDIDFDNYRSELSDLGLTEQQQREFFEALKYVLSGFVEMGFNVDVCGLIFDEFNESSGASVADGKLISSPSMETPSPSDEEDTAP